MAKGVFNPVAPSDEDIILGEGIFYVDYGEAGEAILCATRGGSKLEIDCVIREMQYDGAYGPSKGLRRYERYVPRFMVNSLKTTYDMLTIAMPADSTTVGTYEELTFRLNIEDTDYEENITFVGKDHSGKAMIIKILNPLNDGNIEFDFKEKDEIVSEMTYTGHYDDSTLTTPPIEIWHYDIIT